MALDLTIFDSAHILSRSAVDTSSPVLSLAAELKRGDLRTGLTGVLVDTTSLAWKLKFAFDTEVTLGLKIAGDGDRNKVILDLACLDFLDSQIWKIYHNKDQYSGIHIVIAIIKIYV